MYSNQDLLAQSQTQVTSNLIGLYKALGGGWSISPGIGIHMGECCHTAFTRRF
jgi:hypothetical protein